MCSIYCMLYATAALLFIPITSGALVNGMFLIASVLLNAQSFPIFEWHTFFFQTETKRRKSILLKPIVTKEYLLKCMFFLVSFV